MEALPTAFEFELSQDPPAEQPPSPPTPTQPVPFSQQQTQVWNNEREAPAYGDESSFDPVDGFALVSNCVFCSSRLDFDQQCSCLSDFRLAAAGYNRNHSSTIHLSQYK